MSKPLNFLRLSPDGLADSESDVSLLWPSGQCSACDNPLGSRSALERHVVVDDERTDAWVLRDQTQASLLMISDKLRSQFTPAEADRFLMVRCLVDGQPGLVAWELVLREPEVPFVQDVRRSASGWRCSQCGATSFGYYDGGSIDNVSEGAVAAVDRDAFTIGQTRSTIGLAFSETRWAALEKAGIRSATTRLGVVPDSHLGHQELESR